ncbi:glucose-6-phosphate isomerase [Desulfogranum japonicum]|uniref:glucose-6-phosphate isomerase n=1 Tax=Desulfogranum japonicum TaxID=231447 RepID=UPI000416A1BA|nr:glucose-6-phosphate isomerase [Desulfogranum japonicum]
MQFIDFDTLPSKNALANLAQTPFDLTSDDALSEERLETYVCSSAGFDLLYATQRIDDNVLDSLQQMVDEAGLIEKFAAMKRGAILNFIEGFESEQRQVLHTACRDLFSEAPLCPEATEAAREELDKLKLFLDKLANRELVNSQGQPFNTIIQVGIGGSDLGPRALALALKPFALDGRSARFIANVDPDDAAEVLREVDLSRTLINVVSKSGTTLETLTNEILVRRALEDKGLNPSHHMIAVTGKGSPMDDPSRYLASFYMYDYIGGRYSATSMVGGVTLGFLLGFDGFMEILKGANEVDIASENPSIRRNISLLMAMLGIWNHNLLGYATCAVLPYSQALSRFPAHLQQCDMESNGKSVTRSGTAVRYKTGPVLWGEPGTNGQHAFYQLLHQGTEVVPAEFIGFRKNQYEQDVEVEGTTSQQKLLANLLAQSIALATGRQSDNPVRSFAGNRPNSILLAEQLTPRTLGALLAIYENRIAFQGFCWNINSFDQEGVQLGKVLAGKILAHMVADSKKTAQKKEGSSTEEVLLKVAKII